MDFIQTLYLDKSINLYTHTFGWAVPEFDLMSWALSCLQFSFLNEKPTELH